VFQSISAGAGHTCGLTADGTAYCWGVNYKGQLGDGTMGGRRNSPAAVAGGLVFTYISAGAEHTCGLTTDGVAYCWGDNNNGRLGDGTTTSRPRPVAVARGLVFRAIAGNEHTCGLTRDGAAYCWGPNTFGRLGDGSTNSRLSPVAVSRGLVFKAISVGEYRSCALTTDGAAYCWGVRGQLGNGLTTTDGRTPAAVLDP
jgi:alpha-tubulin suppressor-like RCC1 family protein